LIIDDEQVVIDAVVKICSSEGYKVDSANDAKEALVKLEKIDYRLIICDIMMPGLDGFGFLNEISKRQIDSEVIMTTGFSTVENAVKSLQMGAIDFIPKPFTVDELINSVYRAFNYIKIKKSSIYYKNEPKIDYVSAPSDYFKLGYSSWAKEENTGSILIGATDLFVKTIENIASIELLETDDEIVQGNPCAFIKDKEDRTHPLLSPVTGRIIEPNLNLSSSTSIIEKDPYFEGWFYRLLPSESEYELKNLTKGSSD
jgi:CheY-like chemotaxis protein